MTDERPVDIRNTDPDAYWETFAEKWTSLLTYRYLGRQWDSLDSGVEGAFLTVRHDMRNELGGIMAAPLCVASPECGGFNDDEVVPNPLIASMQILDPAPDVKRLMILPDNLHTGRRLGFSRALVVDAAQTSRVVAISTGVGLSLGPAPDGYEKIDNPPIEVVDSPDLPPLHHVFGAERRSRGVWELPALTAELASPDAALHIGPQHIVLEAAATDLAQDDAGRALQITDWYVMFVNRGKVGPFRTHGECFAGANDTWGVRVNLVDDGDGGRVVSTCAATFR
ncbi:MAG: hypothetical protein O3C62_06225 [Actinomycetota bacterium]|nr:hypothetical protein [Actinomycetota bacterium]MDA2971823.1 hypothetical protein [Actinomycetota bacterium]MDA3001262.1 hypothetical protein [Actinomycetota bacterium]